MPSVITNAFQSWNVNKILADEPAVPDQMVFALVPGQSSTADVDPAEGMPPAAQISYKSGITHKAALNTNAVVYSAVLDTSIGDWKYNWIGLVDSATNTVLMIVHTAEQQKVKTQGGQQGNNLVRNLAMEFAGAAEATQITVTPETWQIDYSARLRSLDESRRVARVDYYGPAAFDGTGFAVSVSGGTATIAPGLGYVGGLRVSLDAAATVAAANTGIWVDAVWSGTVTGAWKYGFNIRTAAALADYVDSAGYQHFVAKIATVSGGVVTDERVPFPLQRIEQELNDLDVYDKSEADERFLQTENNLSDVKDKKKARENLGVYSTDDIDHKCPYRVGDVLLTTSNVSPVNSWPGTSWSDMSGDYDARTIMIGREALKTGGADNVTLTVDNLPSHGHGLSGVKIKTAGAHTHPYDKYQKDGTQDSTRVSVDNVRLGIEQDETGEGGEHSHEIEGEIDKTGNNESFSIVSSFITLRGWLRTA